MTTLNPILTNYKYHRPSVHNVRADLSRPSPIYRRVTHHPSVHNVRADLSCPPPIHRRVTHRPSVHNVRADLSCPPPIYRRVKTPTTSCPHPTYLPSKTQPPPTPYRAILHETFTPAHPHEKDLARRWYNLPSGTLLPLTNGHTYQLIFAGRPGSALGPDIRDAVLHPTTAGDIELHIRASDWFTHQHHRDPRYNNVILHVVLILDDPTPTQRQDGVIIPTCSLHDLSSTAPSPHPLDQPTTWPCQAAIQEMSPTQRASLLKQAGLLRFEQKTHTFIEQLHNADTPTYDPCLVLALAEALGYGRDRAFFRAVGHHLLGLTDLRNTPEPLGRTPNPPPLDAQRLHILRNLITRWHTTSPWQTMYNIITDPVRAASSCPPPIHRPVTPSSNLETPTNPSSTQSLKRPIDSIPQIIAALRSLFPGLSTARTDILICNVVLPFAAAVALIEHDNLLYEHAHTLYEHYPSLSSNQVTRAMCKQLGLPAEPSGACQQQGLHHIYQQTCRQKHCAMCIIGRQTL